MDDGNGDFILNESGTSVEVDSVEETIKEKSQQPIQKTDDDEPYMPPIAEPQKDTTD